MRRGLPIAATLGVAFLLVLALTARLRPWTDFDLVKQAQAEMRHTLAGENVAFPDRPGMRTAIYSAGRPDLRVVCGWLTTAPSDPANPSERFFYVLYQRRLAWVSTETVFVQAHPGEMSPGWGETWCRGKALS